MNKQRTLLRRTIAAYNHEILSNWKYTFPIILLTIIGTILIFYVPPLIIAAIINQQESVTLSNGWHFVALFGASWLIGELLWRLAFFIMAKFEANTIEKLYNHVLEKTIDQDLTFFSNRFAGSITKNLLAFARRFEGYFDTLVFGVFSRLGPVLFALVVLSFISPILSLSLIAFIIIIVLAIRPFIKTRSKIVKEREEIHAELSGHISDVIGNISTVRAFGSEKIELEKHGGIAKRYADKARESWHYHNTRIDMTVSPLYVAINVFALAFILLSGVDNSTKATLFIAFNYFMNVSGFAWEFNGIYRRLEDALTDASLFVSYLDVPKTIKNQSRNTLKVKDGVITFDNVAFSHADSGYDGLFSEFNVKIPAGQKVGLVGHSGAGKSTLANLVLRFADVDDGSISIDGTNIKDVSQASLHQAIAYVAQEPALFHRTLRDNIAYGKPEASNAEIRRAAKQANALEFIETLPHGFDTLVGERGVKLSGGQRQRIAIARAILKDAPILILDEATSALDSESERLIQSSLETLMKGRTSIVIAHRLSTIAKLDRIIVLDNGAIIEDGTHAELLEKNGTYAKLWSHQSGGFIEE